MTVRVIVGNFAFDTQMSSAPMVGDEIIEIYDGVRFHEIADKFNKVGNKTLVVVKRRWVDFGDCCVLQVECEAK